MTNPVWFHHANEWHVLRQAWPGGRVTALCMWARDYGLLLVATSKPTNRCPACERELAAGTAGAAEAPDVGRTTTREIRGGRGSALAEWGDGTSDEVAMADLVSRPMRRPA